MEKLSTHYTHRILQHACEKNASDIHFYPNEESETVSIYFRINGKREFIRVIHKQMYDSLLAHLKFSANMDIAESRRPQDGVIDLMINERMTYSFRLSTLPLPQSESLSIRIIPQTSSYTLKDLLLFPFQKQLLLETIIQPHGLIVFSGPTGTGKSTLMYALIEHITEEKRKQIITLEDPIERRLDTVLQVEINERAGVTYHTGLKAALRHDPDIILIGEIRDEETAQYAIRAALTGHLVLTTVHASDPIGTVRRLLDFGLNKVDILQSLIAIARTELISIYSKKGVRRASIIDFIGFDKLKKMIELETDIKRLYTLEHLKKKAYAYGYIK